MIWLNEFRRGVLVKEPAKAGDEPSDITPKEYAVRTTAQEYGGGAFRIFGDTVIFSNYKDQRLYKHSIDSKGKTDKCVILFHSVHFLSIYFLTDTVIRLHS